MLLKQEIKQLKEQNEAQTRALLESNKLMEEILAMQKNEQVNPEFLSSILMNSIVEKDTNPTSINRQEIISNNTRNRLESNQNELENDNTNKNEFLMLNSSLNRLQQSLDKNVDKV